MDEIGKRIRALRRGTSRKDFAGRFGISAKTLQRYEEGERAPTDALVEALIVAFRVSPAWLRSGEGPMSAQEQDQYRPETPPTDVRDDYIACLRHLADLQKENGDLRLQVAKLEARAAELERQLAESLKPAAPSAVASGLPRVG